MKDQTQNTTADLGAAGLLHKGQKMVLQGRATRQHAARFLGWTDMETKYSETPRFDSLPELLAHYSVSSVEELVALQDSKEYGFHAYAMFESLDDEPGLVFGCYFYEGFLAAGSSADRVFFPGETMTVSEDEDCEDCGERVAPGQTLCSDCRGGEAHAR